MSVNEIPSSRKIHIFNTAIALSWIALALFFVASAAHAESFVVPAAGKIEVAYSPNEGAEELVLKVIDSARHDIKMLSYSFTSVPVAKALINAQRRGVSVTLVADQKDNDSRYAQAALSALSTAGADVHMISVYPIAHDKVIIVDSNTVETGSYNYSKAAAEKNSENVLVNWENPQLARVYLKHFDRNYRQSVPFRPAY